MVKQGRYVATCSRSVARFHIAIDRQSIVICGIFAGWMLGTFAFRYLNDATFRRIVLVVLLASGLMLVA
jgi:hypothetical protein